MEQSFYLDHVHREILDIMDHLVKVCQEHGIRYYITAGTLLGAVRHQGFIPWDDDLDVVMPRTDFDRFVRLPAEAFSPEYELKWFSTDQRYWRIFAKVCKVNTLYIEKQHIRSGIFIDVFPLDDSNGFSRKTELKKTVVRKLSTMISMNLEPNNSPAFNWRISKLFPPKFISGVCTFVETSSFGGSHMYYANYGSQYPIQRQIVKKSWYGDGVLLPFEGRAYLAPEQYDLVLRQLYGDNYMLLPPKEKRRSHYPLYIKFSDGTELHFAEVANKVTIQDTLQ